MKVFLKFPHKKILYFVKKGLVIFFKRPNKGMFLKVVMRPLKKYHQWKMIPHKNVQEKQKENRAINGKWCVIKVLYKSNLCIQSYTCHN